MTKRRMKWNKRKEWKTWEECGVKNKGGMKMRASSVPSDGEEDVKYN